jgi:hypothetical protein
MFSEEGERNCRSLERSKENAQEVPEGEPVLPKDQVQEEKLGEVLIARMR